MNQFQNAFISYGRADSKAFAQKLYNALVQQGLKVWFDFEDIPLGVDYQNQIDEGIETADNFLYIIAPHSVNSPYCAKEVELALRRNKRIIPILHVEQINRDTWQQRNPNGTDAEWVAYQERGAHSSFPNMHPEIAKINWVYCREGVDDFDQALQGLLAIMQRQQTYVRQHTLFLARALEWERQQKQSRYLLVGEERQQAEAWLKVRFKEEQPPCLPTDLHCEFITESTKNGQNLMTQVFLSYAEVEVALMEQVRRSLRRQGFTVWTNRTDIQTGADFQTAINWGIEEADNIVYLISPDSLRSVYCQQEIDYALKLNKRIIPLLVKPTTLEEMPAFLRGLQYIDLTDNTLDLDYQEDESQLLRVLRQDAAYYEEHKVLLTKALKWERQQRNPSILLRGYNLQHAEAWLKLGKQRLRHLPLPLQEEFINASLQQPPGISLDVFVSYSRADSDFARKLNDSLQMQGKTTWFDQESIASGSDFQQEIYRGIENSNHFLFVISPNSINSPYCADEVEYAQKLNKRIVTVLHRPVNPAEMHPVLAAVQWIDFNQREGDFTANFKELLRTIDTDPVHLQTHTRLLVRAIEWDNKGRKDSFLLRGDDLEDAEKWLVESANRDPKPTSLQQDYVHSSRSVETANQQASQILQAAAAKGRQRVMIGTAVMTIGLVVAGIAGAFALKAGETAKAAETQAKAAETQAKAADTQAKTAFQKEQAAKQQAQAARQQTAQAEQREKQAQLRLDRAAKAAAAAENQRRVAEQQLKLASVKTAQAEQKLQRAEKQTKIANQNLNQAKIAQKEAQIATALERSGTNTLRQFEAEQLEALVEAVKTGKQLQAIVKDGRPLANYPTTSPLLVLQTILDNIQEQVPIDLPLKEADQEWGGASGQSFINSASFSPNGQQIVTAEKTAIAYLWDLEGKQLAAIKGTQSVMTQFGASGQVMSASFSTDGNRIVTTSTDGAARIWDVSAPLNKEPKQIKELKTDQGAIKLASFSPDGQNLVTVSFNSDTERWGIQLWDIASSAVTEFKTEQRNISFVAFNPNGRQIVTTSGGETHIWDRSGRVIAKLDGQLSSSGFSPDGQHLVTIAKSTAQVWNFSGKSIVELEDTLESNISDARFSPDGRWLITASENGAVRVWNLTGEQIGLIIGVMPQVVTARFSPDLRRIFATTIDGRLWIWRVFNEPEYVANGAFLGKSPISVVKGERVDIGTAQFSPDGQRLFAWGLDSTRAWLWDLSERQRLLSQIKATKTGSGLSAERVFMIVPIGDGFSNAIHLWDLKGNLLTQFKSPQDSFLYAWFSQDGQHIQTVLTDQKTIQTWSLTGKLVRTQVNAQGWNRKKKVSPDGQKVLTILEYPQQKTVQLSDVAGKQIVQLKGHRDLISDANFSPDSQRIVTASYDKTIRVWDSTGRLIAELTVDQAANNVSFSQDGKQVLYLDTNGNVKAWQVDNLDQLLSRGCRWLSDYLRNTLGSSDSDRHICDASPVTAQRSR